MPGAFPSRIEIRGMGTVEVMHYLRWILGRCFHQQMIVIAHQTIDVHDGAIPFGCRLEIEKELFPVLLALEDLLALIAARGNVIKCPRIFYF